MHYFNQIVIYKLYKKNQNFQLSYESKNVQQVLSMSGTQILSILFLHMILWGWTKKCLYRFLLVTECDFSIAPYVDIRFENILVVFTLAFLMIFGLAFRNKEGFKLVWIQESYSFWFELHYLVLLHFVVDHNLQYFCYLFYMKNN